MDHPASSLLASLVETPQSVSHSKSASTEDQMKEQPHFLLQQLQQPSNQDYRVRVDVLDSFRSESSSGITGIFQKSKREMKDRLDQSYYEFQLEIAGMTVHKFATPSCPEQVFSSFSRVTCNNQECSSLTQEEKIILQQFMSKGQLQ